MPVRKLVKLTAVCDGQTVHKQVALDNDPKTRGKIRRKWTLFLQEGPSLNEIKSWRYWQNGEHLTAEDQKLGGKRKADGESAEVRSVKMAAVRRQSHIITLDTSVFLREEGDYMLSQVLVVKASLTKMLKKAMPVIRALRALTILFISCGSLLALERGRYIAHEDDVDFTGIVESSAFDGVVKFIYANRTAWEGLHGVRILVLGNNDRQITVKVCGHLKPGLEGGKKTVYRSNRWLAEHASTYHSQRALNLFALNKIAGNFQSAEVNTAELLSVQCVDINLCRKGAGGKWRERPFKSIFDVHIGPADIVHSHFLGVRVPTLKHDLAQRWLATAYGDSWRIPDVKPRCGSKIDPRS